MGDPRRWLDEGSPEMKEFVEAGGYGTFAGWVPEGGFMTSNTDGRPPGGSYFKEGKYLTVGGTDQRMVPPDYELIGIDEAVVDGDVGSQHTTPGRMILKRKESPAPPAPAAAPTLAPAPAPTPQPPAPRVDATGPSLADALQRQTSERPALQSALDSALQLDRWKDAGRDVQTSAANSSSDSSGADDSGRRFAASDRWRQRLEEVSSRFA